MTNAPDKEWIERARAFIVSNGKSYDPTMTSQEFADHLADFLARELQSSFDQGVERERERIKQLIADECYDFDSIEHLVTLIDAALAPGAEREK